MLLRLGSRIQTDAEFAVSVVGVRYKGRYLGYAGGSGEVERVTYVPKAMRLRNHRRSSTNSIRTFGQ